LHEFHNKKRNDDIFVSLLNYLLSVTCPSSHQFLATPFRPTTSVSAFWRFEFNVTPDHYRWSLVTWRHSSPGKVRFDTFAFDTVLLFILIDNLICPTGMQNNIHSKNTIDSIISSFHLSVPRVERITIIVLVTNYFIVNFRHTGTTRQCVDLMRSAEWLRSVFTCYESSFCRIIA